MAIKLSTIKAKGVRTAELDFDGETLHCEYNASEITPELADQMTENMKSDKIGPLADFLSQLLVKWDLEDDDGTPIKTDKKTLRKLPIEFLIAVTNGLMEDQSPNVKSASSFAAG